MIEAHKIQSCSPSSNPMAIYSRGSGAVAAQEGAGGATSLVVRRRQSSESRLQQEGAAAAAAGSSLNRCHSNVQSGGSSADTLLLLNNRRSQAAVTRTSRLVPSPVSYWHLTGGRMPKYETATWATVAPQSHNTSAPKHNSLLPPSVASVADSLLDSPAYDAPTLPATSAYVDTMGVILKHIVDGNKPLTPSNRGLQLRFDAVSVPEVAIDDYLERLRRFFSCSSECFVLAMIYIDRLVHFHEGRVILCNLNIHRILVTAVVLAAKYFDDVYYSNSFYAKVGGLSTQEMNVLESHFLNLIKYDLYVSPREYERYRRNVTLLKASQHFLGTKLPEQASSSPQSFKRTITAETSAGQSDCSDQRSVTDENVSNAAVPVVGRRELPCPKSTACI